MLLSNERSEVDMTFSCETLPTDAKAAI
ncbi:hypothetical protein ABHC11_15870, partial [Escherichia coli]